MPHKSQTHNWLSDPLSISVAKTLGVQSEMNKPNKGTIGIAGHFSIQNSLFNIELVKAGNEIGYKDDQDHPEVIAMGLSLGNDFTSLVAQVKMLSDNGCDVIAIPERLSIKQAEYLESAAQGARIKSIEYIGDIPSEDYHSFANRVLKGLESKTTKRRPNTYDSQSYDTIIQNLSQDIVAREKREVSRRDDGGYGRIDNFVKDHSVVGIVGGAGPMASAVHSFDLAQKGTPYIHHSNNSAPYKVKFALEQGHSFLSHYLSSMSMLSDNGCSHIAMPCNTAHLFFDTFRDNSKLKSRNLTFLDIRDALTISVRESRNAKFILLGTDATVGIDKDGNYHCGLYDKVIMQNLKCDIIKPNRHQQDLVMTAIYDAKVGKMEQARNQINRVIVELRGENQYDIGVILGCTDLPIAYDINQLSEVIGAISTIESLSQFATSSIFKKINEVQSSNKNDSETDLTQRTSSESSSDPHSEVSEKETTDNKESINKIAEKYQLSYSKNRNEIRVKFESKEGSDLKNIDKQDIKNFSEFFAENGVLLIRTHLKSNYVTLMGGSESALTKLQGWIKEQQIPLNDNALGNGR